MGYELTGFVSDVDEEFQCSICTTVLEDPVQTPCEHSFCIACIKGWLSITQTCPIDRKPLEIGDLKPPNRSFRNLWNKLDIKCDFQREGCCATINLENLGGHVCSCEYNLNSEIVCDKGCNMTITRREYKINNCFSHLANRVIAQEKENIKLSHDLSDQKEHFLRIVNVQQDEIRKLNDELSRQRSQQEHFENAFCRQQRKTTELIDKFNILCRPLKWRQCDNMKIERSNILKIDNPSCRGVVQSEYRLEPGTSYFRVYVLDIGTHRENTCIGLRTDEHKWFINYWSDGRIYVNDAKVHDVPQWKVGDIIKCGLKFPNNFINDGNHIATVYFSRNEELIFEKSVTISKDYLFPRILICNKDTRLQYYQ